MRQDRRPYPAKRAYLALERAYMRHFVAPQFEAFDPHFSIVMRPWRVDVSGHNISAGKSLHAWVTVGLPRRLYIPPPR